MSEPRARGGRSIARLALVAAALALTAGGAALSHGSRTSPSVPQPQHTFSVAPPPSPASETDQRPLPSIGRHRLIYARLNVDAAWAWVGLDASGTMNSPRPPHVATTVGRLDDAKRSGHQDWASGVVFVGGHVEWNDTKGVLFDLARARSGDRLLLSDGDGTTHEFAVTTLTTRPHDAPVAPASFRARGWKRGDLPTLVLTTCGGDLREHRFSESVFVVARPVR